MLYDVPACVMVYTYFCEHSDLPFGNGFMTLDYGFGTLTTNLYILASLIL